MKGLKSTPIFATDGSQYYGQVNDEVQRHGFGCCVTENGANGTYYEGEWKNDQRHGFGGLVYPDGAKYTGRFQIDKRHGYGTIKYITGDVYKGNW